MGAPQAARAGERGCQRDWRGYAVALSKVQSVTNRCAWNAVSTFANCGRAVAFVRGSYVQISDQTGTCAELG